MRWYKDALVLLILNYLLLKKKATNLNTIVSKLNNCSFKVGKHLLFSFL